MLVTIEDAKFKLSELITPARSGDDVVIARDGKPAARLVPVPPSEFRFGTLAHLVVTVPDFDESMGDDGLALWEGDGEEAPRRKRLGGAT